MKIKSPKGLLALWSAFLAAGTWMLPAGALLVQPVSANAAPRCHDKPQPTGPGEWVWRHDANMATAMRDASIAVSGQAAPQGTMLSIVEVGGQQHLSLVSSDPQVDITHWTIPLGRTAMFPMPAQSSSQMIEGEGGVVGVATHSVTIQPVLIELSALPAAPALLGVQVQLDLSVQQTGSGAADGQVNAIIPLEFGYSFESELGPLSALAAVMSGTAKSENSPTAYPIGGVNLYNIDCTQHPTGSGRLGCFCDCWRDWKGDTEDAHDNFMVELYGAGILILAAALVCMPICILTLPAITTGGGFVGLAAICVQCMKATVGGSIGLVTAALLQLAASMLYYWQKREDCVRDCGLQSSPQWVWEDVEPAKIANE